MHRASHITKIALSVAILLFAKPSFAAGLYFDLAPILWCVFFAFFGLIVFPLGMASSKPKDQKHGFGMLSIIAIAFASIIILNALGRDKGIIKGEGGKGAVKTVTDAEAFAQYCADKYHFVVYPESLNRPAVIFSEDARSLAWSLSGDLEFCKHSAKITMKPFIKRSYDQPEYIVCANNAEDEESALTKTPMEYQMSIHDSSEQVDGLVKLPAAWGKTTVYKKSIVLARKQDKYVVAEANFYFFDSNFVVKKGCPDPKIEIPRLLVKALPKI